MSDLKLFFYANFGNFVAILIVKSMIFGLVLDLFHISINCVPLFQVRSYNRNFTVSSL